MCGICGLTAHDPPVVGRMNDRLRHRGPDSEGTFVADGLSLGNRRLKVIDTSSLGDLPMLSHDGGSVLVYNGEVYNFQSLRQELLDEGVRFRSHSDAEVVVNLLQRDGIEALPRFDGMFALGFYDKKRRTLLLARDRMGIKPLYYAWNGVRLIFASEMKALVDEGVETTVDPDALTQFFTYRFNYGSQTLLRGIRKLDPGHYLEFDVAASRVLREGAWVRPAASVVPIRDEGEASERLRELVTDAVRKRLIADVPLGFFLSGGIDSSILTGVAAQLGSDLKTFSAGFDTTNELSHARVASNHFGSDHTEIHIGDEALDELDDVVYHMDEPIGDAAFVATYILSREARKQVTVVLAGEGADELFAGYDRYKLALYGDRLSRYLPAGIRRRLGGLQPRAENWRRLVRVLGEETASARFLEVIRLFSDEEMRSLGLVPASNGLPSLGDGDVLSEFQRFDVRTLLPNDFFMKADKMASAWGLEERVPFLDERVVDFAFSLPRAMKLSFGQEKRILRKAFWDLLPPTIRGRRKHGFDVPMDHWLRHALYDRLHALLEERIHGLFDTKPLLQSLEAFRSTSGRYKTHFFEAQKLWSVLMFEMWYRRFVRQPVSIDT